MKLKRCLPILSVCFSTLTFLSQAQAGEETEQREAIEHMGSGLRISEFLGSASVREPLAEGAWRNLRSLMEDGEILVGWYYTGKIGRLARSSGLPIGSCPATLESGQQESCLMGLFYELLGEAVSPNTLEFAERRVVGNVENMKFNHLYEGVRVMGGVVKFTLDPSGNVLSVRSTLIPELDVPLGESRSSLGDSLGTFNLPSAQAALESALGEEVTVNKERDRIWVDREARSQVGLPVKVITASSLDHEGRWMAKVNALTGELLSVQDATENSKDVALNTYARFPEHFAPQSSCSECDGGDCSDHYSNDVCVSTCAAGSDCTDLMYREYTDELCSDSSDNDGDSYTDCSDLDCSCFSSCSCSSESTNFHCEDGLDNDGDGDPDCDDSDCACAFACGGDGCNDKHLECQTAEMDPYDADGVGYCGIGYGDIFGHVLTEPTRLVPGPPALELYTEHDGQAGVWTDSLFSSHIAVSRTLETLQDVKAFHNDVLGFNGWIDLDRKYCVSLLYNGFKEHLLSPFMGHCAFGASANWDGLTNPQNCVLYCDWLGGNLGTDSDNAELSHRSSALTHEFTHWFFHELNGGDELHLGNCLHEGIPNIFGALLSAQQVSSGYPWYEQKWSRYGRVTNGLHKWRNYSCGLDFCFSHEMPYSQRAFFDYIPCDGDTGGTYVENVACEGGYDGVACPPYVPCLYEDTTYPTTRYPYCTPSTAVDCYCSVNRNVHNNGDVWRRFVRLLADGTGSLADDGESENLGATIGGTGLECAAKVIWQALQDMTEDDGLVEWVDSLRTAATTLGSTEPCDEVSPSASDVMERALEATGLPERWDLVGGLDEEVKEGKVVGAYWSSWSQSSYVWFWAYVSDADGNLYLRYKDDSESPQYVDSLIQSAGDFTGRPSLVQYRNRMYVFWTDTQEEDYRVAYRFITDSTPPTLSAKRYLTTGQALPEGQFAVAANDNAGMAAVFTKDTGRVCVSLCTETSDACQPGDWSPSTGGGDCGATNLQAWPTLAATWAKDVNGMEVANEGSVYSLYVFNAVPSGEYAGRLRVTRGIFDQGSLEWRHSAQLPVHSPYPNSVSTYNLAMTVRRSAFSTNNYLYLLWRAFNFSDESKRLTYLTVVQDFGESEDSDAFCDDAVDNDADGYTDCYDSDCDCAVGCGGDGCPNTEWLTLPADWKLNPSDWWPQASFIHGWPSGWDYYFGIVATRNAGTNADRAQLMSNRYRY